jgi:hypothetical protein
MPNANQPHNRLSLSTTQLSCQGGFLTVANSPGNPTRNKNAEAQAPAFLMFFALFS